MSISFFCEINWSWRGLGASPNKLTFPVEDADAPVFFGLSPTDKGFTFVFGSWDTDGVFIVVDGVDNSFFFTSIFKDEEYFPA